MDKANTNSEKILDNNYENIRPSKTFAIQNVRFIHNSIFTSL